LGDLSDFRQKGKELHVFEKKSDLTQFLQKITIFAVVAATGRRENH
jgi:hypothetical protein